MKNSIKQLLLIAPVYMVTILPAISQIGRQKSSAESILQSDSVFFSALVSQYVRSVNEADTVFASGFWSKTAEVSYFSPDGTYAGWEGVKKVYQDFKNKFIVRKLSVSNLNFSYSRDVSWVTFFWDFNGILKNGNTPVETTGRETQIWKKINMEWRLVHVHYSERPKN